MTEFAIILRGALKASGMKQVELAEKARCDNASISNYLKGKTEPRPETKRRIIAILHEYVQNDSPTISIEHAAALLGKSKEWVARGLRDGLLPFGYAVKMSSKWSYCITKAKFKECTGIDPDAKTGG